MIRQRFDVLIVGGGLAGSALACALGGSDLRVALVESRPLHLRWPSLANGVAGYDTRVSAITAASQRWLMQLGAWGDVAARRLQPYRHMHVWEADGTGTISFDATEVNEAALGHIVENRLLAAALLHTLEAYHNVQILSPAAVESFERGDDHIDVGLADGRQLRARLLVGADGGDSAVRKWAGIDCREWGYGHDAIVATIATERPHAETAWQIFQRAGPLALLPLPAGDSSEHYCSIVWSTEPDHAAHLMALDDQAFAHAVGRASEQRLGCVTKTGPRALFPLRARHARQYTAPGMALVADAAHTIHPLAGQGINLGFADVRVLAEELLRGHRRGLTADDASVLARYQRRRKADNLAMLVAMDGFKRLFAADPLPLRLLRNSGMRLVDRLPSIKRILIRQAMGI